MRVRVISLVAALPLFFEVNLVTSARAATVENANSDQIVAVDANGNAVNVHAPFLGPATGARAINALIGTGDVTVGFLTTSETDTAASPPTQKKDALSTLNLDRPISAVPAFTALDVSPETVSQPSSPRELGAALLNGVDRHGVLQTGIAIETAPLRVFHMMPTDIKSYQAEGGSGYWNRFLYNFSLSIATTKASEKSDAVQLALGLGALLYQDKESDPRTSEGQTAIFNAVNVAYPMQPSAGGTPEENPEAKNALQLAADEFRKNQWKGMTWVAAIAPTWTSKSGKISDLAGTGFATWTTAAYGWNEPVMGKSIRAQILGQARYRQDEFVVDPNDKNHFAKQDTFIAAARLRLGSVDFNAFGEAGYFYQWHGLNGSGGGGRGAGGIEKRIANNLWLVLSVGEQFGGSAAKTDELYAIGSLRIGTADTAQYPSAQ